MRNAHIDTAVALLKRGANVNDVATDGSSALSMATVNAYFELASVLLDHGANPNLPDPRGSPLHTIAWLRKPGADGAAGVGNTPQARRSRPATSRRSQLARKLLEHGANPNVRVDWQEPTLRQGRRHRAQSTEYPARSPSSQLHRRHTVLRRREERRRRADAAARRVQGGPDDHRR